MNALLPLQIKIIIGSTREGRFGEKPARFIHEKIKKQDGIHAELLDLRDYSMPFFNESASPSMKREDYKNEAVVGWTQKIAEADGFVIVTPEYNHGYPAVLKNALDYVYKEWNKKPVWFVSYGGTGGVRAVEQLRLIAIELQMVPIKSALHIPQFWTLVDEKGNLKTETLEASADSFIEQLLWWAKVLKSTRA